MSVSLMESLSKKRLTSSVQWEIGIVTAFNWHISINLLDAIKKELTYATWWIPSIKWCKWSSSWLKNLPKRFTTFSGHILESDLCSKKRIFTINLLTNQGIESPKQFTILLLPVLFRIVLLKQSVSWLGCPVGAPIPGWSPIPGCSRIPDTLSPGAGPRRV